jgi:hypothetical protein
MEPIRHTTYYEDVYTRSERGDDDSVEAGGRFDLCEESETSSDDGTDEKSSKYTKKHPKHPTSYGTIKKPTCKAIPDPAKYSHMKINSTKTSREQK